MSYDLWHVVLEKKGDEGGIVMTEIYISFHYSVAYSCY